jgi:hypothetical protein
MKPTYAFWIFGPLLVPGLVMFCPAEEEAVLESEVAAIGANPGRRLTTAVLQSPLVFQSSQADNSSNAPFISRGPGYNLVLGASEALLMLNKGSAKPQIETPTGFLPETFSARGNEGEEVSVLRIRFVGANPATRLSGGRILPSKSSRSCLRRRPAQTCRPSGRRPSLVTLRHEI